MRDLSEEQRYVAGLLVAVVKDEISGGDAIALLEQRSWERGIANDKPMALAYHTLRHFDIDADIRRKDADYDQRMRLELQRQADVLLRAAQGQHRQND